LEGQEIRILEIQKALYILAYTGKPIVVIFNWAIFPSENRYDFRLIDVFPRDCYKFNELDI